MAKVSKQIPGGQRNSGPKASEGECLAGASHIHFNHVLIENERAYQLIDKTRVLFATSIFLRPSA